MDNIYCRHFKREDLKQVNEWYKAHDLPLMHNHQIPNHGYIVDDIAAGFLYTTDSSIAFLEGYISNPKSDKRERKWSLDAITRALLLDAEDIGYERIIAVTANDSIKKRCNDYGFEKKNTADVFIKDL